MPFWSCSSCGKVGSGRSPSWRQPRRCSRCEMLVWPDGLYSYERDTPLRTDLGVREYPQVVSYMRAEIRADGDLVLEFQDFGPLAELMTGGESDYEYWVTVPASHLTDLVRRLAKELATRSINTGAEGETPDSGRHGEDVNRLSLILLRTAYRTGVFATDTDFRDWLKRKRIPSRFASY